MTPCGAGLRVTDVSELPWACDTRRRSLRTAQITPLLHAVWGHKGSVILKHESRGSKSCYKLSTEPLLGFLLCAPMSPSRRLWLDGPLGQPMLLTSIEEERDGTATFL
eukprot:264557-Prymnesium_polylepis.2